MSDGQIKIVANVVFVANSIKDKVIKKICRDGLLAEELSFSEREAYRRDYPKIKFDPGYSMIRIHHSSDVSVESLMAGVAKRVI
ncbi:MAG: hypothetical protein WA091_01840 [Minisyncoccales bacterium]